VRINEVDGPRRRLMIVSREMSAAIELTPPTLKVRQAIATT
jgi:hypothetical protein